MLTKNVILQKTIADKETQADNKHFKAFILVTKAQAIRTKTCIFHDIANLL